MSLLRLAWRNIAGSSFRSWVVFLCALFVSGLALSSTLVMRGAENSLHLAMERLGADIIIVPEGAESKVESALLMGQPAAVWMPQANLQKIAAVSGVAAVSPQLYLSTLKGADCCSASEMFLVAYDPATDFTVTPWLQRNLHGGLSQGDAVGGTHVFVPAGEQNIKVYGYYLTLKGNLEPTGTALDQSLFFTFDTARDVARLSQTQARTPLELPADSVSSVLVKLAPGADTTQVSVDILKQVPNVTPIQSPNLFQSYRKQMLGMLKAILAVLGITCVVSMVLIGLVFSMAVNERRREIGVLRALGSTRSYVFRSVLAEAGILAVSGGIAGTVLAALATLLFRHAIMTSLGIPFLFPSLLPLLGLVLAGLGVTLAGVTLAALLPAYRISHQDPALAMRE
jgi:putative ABC transport system permease protein